MSGSEREREREKLFLIQTPQMFNSTYALIYHSMNRWSLSFSTNICVFGGFIKRNLLRCTDTWKLETSWCYLLCAYFDVSCVEASYSSTLLTFDVIRINFSGKWFVLFIRMLCTELASWNRCPCRRIIGMRKVLGLYEYIAQNGKERIHILFRPWFKAPWCWYKWILIIITVLQYFSLCI